MSNIRDDRYGSLRYPSRRSPESNVHNTLYIPTQGGRTVLPPLTTVQPSYTGSQQLPSPPRASSRNEPYSPSYAPVAWSSNNQGMNEEQQYSYDYDPYPAQTTYAQYPQRQNLGMSVDPHGMQRLPPLHIPHEARDDRWQGAAVLPTSYPSTSMHVPSMPNIRSPVTTYSPNYEPYSHLHANPYSSGISTPPDMRHLPPPLLPYGHQISHGPPYHSDWGTGGGPRVDTHGISPYARNARDTTPSGHSHPSTSPIDYPIIKKKRKRADAAQLKVLNDVYARTAFPTTEERLELARQLDMSARSVQIWFQNKRQSTRQSRSTSNAMPPTAHHPYGPSMASTSPIEAPTPIIAGRGAEISVSGPSPGSSYGSRSGPDVPRLASRSPAPSAGRRGRTPGPEVSGRRY